MANIDLEEIEEIKINLELEDEGEVECEVICIFEYEGRDYAALTPTDESVEELYFFGLDSEEQGDEMEFTLLNIEDESLLEELSQVFDQIIDSENGDLDDDDELTLDLDEEDDEDDEDDDKWDKFINKKLED